MKIAISQPTYLPWIGYFDIIRQVDVFVFLDNVQFSKQSWQQRNKIKSPNGALWLSVPVFKTNRYGQLIKDVVISNEDFWEKHAKTIESNYRKADYFHEYHKDVVKIMQLNNKKLVDLNVNLIKFFMDILGIKTQTTLASQLKVNGKRSELLVNICKELGASQYFSTIGAKTYLLEEIELFWNNNIEVYFHNYEHPTYRQNYPPFIPYLAIIDLIYNEGPNSYKIIASGSRHWLTVEEVALLNEDRENKHTNN